MNRSAIEELLQALTSERPVVLFLGQDHANRGETPDAVLAAFISRVGVNHEVPPKWKNCFDARSVSDADYEWLSERFDRNVQDEALEQVFQLAWSAVFTSSIDQKVAKRLETRGRVPEVVLAKDHYARVARSKSRPAVHYLFGRADEAGPENRPPKSKIELRQRTAIHSAQMLSRLGDTATPLGVIVIDGYRDDSDWLEIEALLAPISTKPGPRVLWFGSVGNSLASDLLGHMESEGLLLRVPQTLAEALVEAHVSHGDLGSIYHSETGTVSLPDEKFLRLSASLRLRVEAAAAIVDDTWTDPAPPLIGVSSEDSFRRFHGDFGGPRTIVEGVGRGYAIERDFERHLFTTSESMLKKLGELESFVVLHGQSGVGKSIALARLARALRSKAKVPVLFAWGRMPAATELDVFCEECERAGAPATVIICDGNHSFERYRELTSGLKSRGRRIVVIGSSYRIEDPKVRSDSRFIEAPDTLSEKETQSLRTLLINFGSSDIAKMDIGKVGEHFLALLYRYLSVARSRLAGGVSSEARSAETIIRERSRTLPKSLQQPSLLAQKLIDAGLGKETFAVFEEDASAAQVGLDSAAKLIDYVMVAGRLDCAVPINLLMRALRSDHDGFDPTQIGYLFQELDLFRWKMGDPEGNDFLVQPRLQLEAELICRRRMADPERELVCLLDLIRAVRATSIDQKSELQFLLDLLHKLHRDGPRKGAYRAGYLRIGRALTDLREMHQISDASVMLQESAFRRDAIFDSDKREIGGGFSDIERDQILNEAREVVELALSQMADGRLRVGRRARQNFAVERASIYGFLAVGLAKSGAKEEQIWPQYLAARTAIAQAVSTTDNYFPLDIGIWTPFDIVSSVELSIAHKAEMQADILAMLDQARTDVHAPSAAEKFHSRRIKVAPLLDDLKMEKEAYDELEKLNPPVAYFLRARAICPEVFQDDEEVFSVSVLERAKKAADFLEEHRQLIRTDTRCLQLLLQLKWIAATGARMLRRERCLLPREANIQSYLLTLVSTLNAAAGDGARNVFRLLEATLEWTQGDIPQARDLFRSLSRDTEFEDSSRVVRRLLLDADEGGFKGRIERQRSEGHWDLRVDGFVGTIDLLERDFASEELRAGREIRHFNIAFNYLGPIADPLPRHGARL